LFGEEFDDQDNFEVGVDIPPEVSQHKCIYDMILVERYSAPTQTVGGLFLPQVEGKDQKHIGKVLSVPDGYGLESEQGRVEPIGDIAPYKVGDVIFIRDPWGIGPKQIEVDKRCFSFHKAAQIMGRVNKM
jgi:co-chaperonin GroES (HSP10)